MDKANSTKSVIRSIRINHITTTVFITGALVGAAIALALFVLFNQVDDLAAIVSLCIAAVLCVSLLAAGHLAWSAAIYLVVLIPVLNLFLWTLCYFLIQPMVLLLPLVEFIFYFAALVFSIGIAVQLTQYIEGLTQLATIVLITTVTLVIAVFNFVAIYATRHMLNLLINVVQQFDIKTGWS